METLPGLLSEIDRLKLRLDELRPLDSPSVLHALEIEYTYESNRIEGNTLTLLHERLATIHLFIDGNGRAARLAMNLALLSAGYPIANIPGDLDSRMAYYAALEKCSLEGDKSDFIALIANHALAMSRRLLEMARPAPEEGDGQAASGDGGEGLPVAGCQ